MEDLVEEQCQKYLSLEESEPYIQDIIDRTVSTFKIDVRQQAESNYTKIYAKVEDQRKELRQILDTKLDHVEYAAKEKACAQDEIIDLISCEIHKDSKKKSDIYLEISNIKEIAYQ